MASRQGEGKHLALDARDIIISNTNYVIEECKDMAFWDLVYSKNDKICLTKTASPFIKNFGDGGVKINQNVQLNNDGNSSRWHVGPIINLIEGCKFHTKANVEGGRWKIFMLQMLKVEDGDSVRENIGWDVPKGTYRKLY